MSNFCIRFCVSVSALCIYSHSLTDPIEGMTHADFIELFSKYKFAITMENGICTDYITEKFWRPLYVGTIPIVLGSPSIQVIICDNRRKEVTLVKPSKLCYFNHVQKGELFHLHLPAPLYKARINKLIWFIFWCVSQKSVIRSGRVGYLPSLIR